MTKKTEFDLIIIGGGLTGLSLAYFLRDSHLKVAILEGRDRLGGRIFTNRRDEMAPLEMGATWLGSQHVFLQELLTELGIGIFEQKIGNTAIYEYLSTSPWQLVNIPDNPDPSFRIQGGSSRLINALAEALPQDSIFLNSNVSGITEEEDGLVIQSDQQLFKAKKLVSTLPPYLLQRSIDISPKLSTELQHIMKNTHTWMGESIKVAFRFKEPFWEAEGISSTIFSNVGPISEAYEHSDFEGKYHAIKGFFNSSFHPLGKEERKNMALKQLRKYYGSRIEEYIDYEEMLWSKESLTYAPYEGNIFPHQNNGHAIFQKAHLSGKLFIAGTESSPQFGGYMEGAIRSAHFVKKMLL
ncbi:MAG: FAD-dependent oxidoreductase [Bacteroidia bacterium]|nr:FAD-dependent oxidoreductase [Bacteroidia bacterium]